jgi:hypothetical protein
MLDLRFAARECVNPVFERAIGLRLARVLPQVFGP